MKTFSKLGVLIATGLLTAGPALAQVVADAEANAVATRNVRVLPPDISRSLKIARTPLPPTVAFLVGTYWKCHEDSGFQICRLTTVVCNDGQTLCVEL